MTAEFQDRISAWEAEFLAPEVFDAAPASFDTPNPPSRATP